MPIVLSSQTKEVIYSGLDKQNCGDEVLLKTCSGIEKFSHVAFFERQITKVVKRDVGVALDFLHKKRSIKIRRYITHQSVSTLVFYPRIGWKFPPRICTARRSSFLHSWINSVEAVPFQGKIFTFINKKCRVHINKYTLWTAMNAETGSGVAFLGNEVALGPCLILTPQHKDRVSFSLCILSGVVSFGSLSSNTRRAHAQQSKNYRGLLFIQGRLEPAKERQHWQQE